MFFDQIVNEISTQLVRSATGQLFTKEQIRQITKHSLGRYFESLFPEDEEELNRAERLAAAQQHIETASKIMAEMRVELDAQTETLNRLLIEIDEKKSLAETYGELAKTNHKAASAMRMEIEEAVGQELVRQSNHGRSVRRLASAVLWILTLILGAALGTYFKDIVDWSFALLQSDAVHSTVP